MIRTLRRLTLGLPVAWLHDALDAAYDAGRAVGVAEERVRWLLRAEDPDEVELGSATAAVDQAFAAAAALDEIPHRP